MAGGRSVAPTAAATPTDAVVVAAGLTHRYGRLAVLSDVDMALRAGQRVALRGANGAGKTTLLRILAGLLRPQAGQVERFDAAAAPGAVAFVGPQPQLYPELTAREHLVLFAQLHGLAAPEAAAAAALAAFGLAARPNARARQLSRGQQQRLALARAFMTAPRLVLLDEPWTALDEDGAQCLDRAIAGAAAGGAAVLFAAHDDGRAALAPDRVVTLARGRLDEVPPPAVRRRPEADDVPAAPAATPAAATPAAARAGRGAGLWRGAALIVGKDVRAELRARELVPAVGVFAALCGTVLAYAFGDAMADLPRVAPGAYWVALLFGGTLGLGRLMAAELDGDALSALRLSPLDPGALFVGKWAAASIFGLTVATALAPLWVALFALEASAALGLIAVAAAGVPGWAAVGVLVAALGATARGREVVLPILAFPLLLPLVLAAVRASAAVIGGATTTALGPALALMGAYGVVFWVVGLWLFPFVVESG